VVLAQPRAAPKPARNTSEGDRRRRRMAHCRGRPSDPRCFGRRCCFLSRTSASTRSRCEFEASVEGSPMPTPAFFSSEPAEALADRLVGDEPGASPNAYFVSGGSEAIEASIKLARQLLSKAVSRSASAHRPSPELPRQYAWGVGSRRETPGGANPMRRCCRQSFSHVTPASPITKSTTVNPRQIL